MTDSGFERDLYVYNLWFVDYVFSKPGALLHINNYVCSLLLPLSMWALTSVFFPSSLRLVL